MEWREFIQQEVNKDYFLKLIKYINAQGNTKEIYPEPERLFACFNFFKVEETKVVIVGQDPYHTPGFANGLAFAVNQGVVMPKSLVNIFKELKDDLGIARLDTELRDWAAQGVLLLNRVLTVNKGEPNSHKNQGWEEFTNAAIKLVNDKCKNVVFVLWGNNAQELKPLIDESKHLVLCSSHPSPLGYYKSFKGSKPFSKINAYLKQHNKKEIKW
ncbi:MAG: uracil-DNA glycosylase [Mycoplasma sp.]|nr:uracil-DNA glycosylase [Candidatus Hennigella equi]